MTGLEALLMLHEQHRMEMRGIRRRGAGGEMVGLLLVQTFIEYRRLDRKPPVTAGLIAANTLIYLRPNFLDSILPTLNQVYFNPHLIIKNKDLQRLLVSAFYHINEPHLVYNMLSLLWKGIQLENSMGSVKFAKMVAALLGMSQGITLLLAKTLVLFGYNRPYYNEYSVGFSGMLFAMQVVLYSQSDSFAYLHGIMIPANYAVWAELLLVQLLVPESSFLGHLGGVLAGISYVYLTRSPSASRGLARLLSWPSRLERGLDRLLSWILRLKRGLTRLLSWPLRYFSGLLRPQPPRVFGAAAVWTCGACTYVNSPLLTACQMCGAEDSHNGNGNGNGDNGNGNGNASSDGHPISLEELRQRRLQRFGR